MQAECRIIPANAPLPVPRLSAYRPDHLLTALPLLLAGLAVARLGELSEFFLSLFNVLPTLLLLLGGAFCVVYGRHERP